MALVKGFHRSVAVEHDSESAHQGHIVVKTRLSRGRANLRRLLFERTGANASEAFPFDRPRCDRVVAGVLKRIGRQAAVAEYSDSTSG